MPSIFAAISWDCTVRVYEIANNTIMQKSMIQLPGYPLTCAWRSDGNALFIAISDNTIRMVDFSSNAVQKFADTGVVVHKMKAIAAMNAIITFDASNTLKAYMQNNPAPVASLQLKYPVMNVDVSEHMLMIVMGDGYLTILDLNSLSAYAPTDVVYTESQLKSPLGSCAINAKTMDFVVASVDGLAQKGNIIPQSNMNNANKRIYVPNPVANSLISYVFIPHSVKSQSNNTSSDMYEVSKCGFNGRSDHFLYTAGGDGMLIFWDLKAKNKVTSININNPITASCINNNGMYIAIATGYDWSKGVWGLGEVNYKPRIGIRMIGDNELVYKAGGNTFK